MSVPPPAAVPTVASGRAIRSFRAYVALTFAFAWVPVMYTAFTVDRGFSPGQYLQLWSLYYASMVLAEVPFGWAADRWGCRPLLVAGPCVLAASFAVLGHAQSFGTCAVAMAAIGAGHAMISGADSAWLYDLLVSADRRADALREETIAHRWRLLGVSVLDVLGGFVAWRWGTVATFDLSVGVMLLAAALALRLPAPAVRGGPLPRPSWAGARAALVAPGVGWVLGWYAAVFVLLRLGFQLYQPTLLALGADDLRLHGALLGGLNLVAGLTAYAVVRVHARMGERATATGVLLLLAASFGGLSLLGAGSVLLLCCLQQIAFAFLQPLGRTALNHRIPAADRASLLSVQSMLARLACAAALALGPWDWALAQQLPATYRTLAVASLLCMVLSHRAYRVRRPEGSA